MISDTYSPYYNLAMEEYLLREKYYGEDILYLWINEPTIVIGKNQNAIAEINRGYVEQNKIHVVRRLSGGGAVYHDFGNLNFTFITKTEGDCLNNYKLFTTPVIQALRKIGVPAEFSGRNDIVIEEKKISGNAQYYHGDRMFHHGTLLFQADLTAVGKALQVNPLKMQSKGVKSVRARVCNISEYLSQSITVFQFRDLLLEELIGTEGAERLSFTPLEKEQIVKLSEEKYRSWNWIYGESPKFELKKEAKLEGGILEFYLSIKNGIIAEIKILGDFLSTRDIEVVESLLVGKFYRREAIQKELEQICFEDYFPMIPLSDFLRVLVE